jgi:hypothetical protein
VSRYFELTTSKNFLEIEHRYLHKIKYALDNRTDRITIINTLKYNAVINNIIKVTLLQKVININDHVVNVIRTNMQVDKKCSRATSRPLSVICMALLRVQRNVCSCQNVLTKALNKLCAVPSTEVNKLFFTDTTYFRRPFPPHNVLKT